MEVGAPASARATNHLLRKDAAPGVGRLLGLGRRTGGVARLRDPRPQGVVRRERRTRPPGHRGARGRGGPSLAHCSCRLLSGRCAGGRGGADARGAAGRVGAAGRLADTAGTRGSRAERKDGRPCRLAGAHLAQQRRRAGALRVRYPRGAKAVQGGGAGPIRTAGGRHARRGRGPDEKERPHLPRGGARRHTRTRRGGACRLPARRAARLLHAATCCCSLAVRRGRWTPQGNRKAKEHKAVPRLRGQAPRAHV
mmetsp:Transcript_9471/g.27882  ORF Transcript_9471/g.27882 Transcript_9471/m.27882 type:complete len:253 (-) Transcript_9471:1075-1833(-)